MHLRTNLYNNVADPKSLFVKLTFFVLAITLDSGPVIKLSSLTIYSLGFRRHHMSEIERLHLALFELSLKNKQNTKQRIKKNVNEIS